MKKQRKWKDVNKEDRCEGLINADMLLSQIQDDLQLLNTFLESGMCLKADIQVYSLGVPVFKVLHSRVQMALDRFKQEVKQDET